MALGKREWSDLEFVLEGVRFVAYWCMTEGESNCFPKVRALEKAPPRLLRKARIEGVARLKNRQLIQV